MTKRTWFLQIVDEDKGFAEDNIILGAVVSDDPKKAADALVKMLEEDFSHEGVQVIANAWFGTADYPACDNDEIPYLGTAKAFLECFEDIREAA